jgi:hypothetical protein
MSSSSSCSSSIVFILYRSVEVLYVLAYIYLESHTNSLDRLCLQLGHVQ